jgi:enoyl-CoA hydratase/carnithine racemase
MECEEIRPDVRDQDTAGAIRRDGGGQFTLRVFECTKPVIAADDARIGFVFTRRGIVPEACSSWFLPRVVGIGRAMEWVAWCVPCTPPVT